MYLYVYMYTQATFADHPSFTEHFSICEHAHRCVHPESEREGEMEMGMEMEMERETRRAFYERIPYSPSSFTGGEEKTIPSPLSFPPSFPLLSLSLFPSLLPSPLPPYSRPPSLYIYIYIYIYQDGPTGDGGSSPGRAPRQPALLRWFYNNIILEREREKEREREREREREIFGSFDTPTAHRVDIVPIMTR
jgi:hypothetical protein